MGGFLSLYDETDRIDLGGGYYVDIKRYLSDAEHDVAQRALVSPRIESTVAASGTDETVRAVTTTVDQAAYNHEVLVAAITGWNLTDRGGNPLPLPPYLPAAKLGADDIKNRVRRESIRLLPAFATKRILAKILENEKRGEDDPATFPAAGESTPATP